MGVATTATSGAKDRTKKTDERQPFPVVPENRRIASHRCQLTTGRLEAAPFQAFRPTALRGQRRDDRQCHGPFETAKGAEALDSVSTELRSQISAD